MSQLSRTQTQLKSLDYPVIGIELMDRSKHFGKVSKFTRDTIYFIDGTGVELDVPRRLIQRAFLLLKGGLYSDGPASISKQNKSKG